jgi:NAD(P)-dependent dehydrogenase (short-subunit alcohol dehydrogenase family)
MVDLNAAKVTNSKFFKLHSAAALIVGGTSGIGQSIGFRIAHYSEKPVIVISGRNEQRGQTTIEALQKINKEGSYSFEKCDIASLDDSRALVDRLSKKYNAFNLLIISSGGLSTKQRTLTVDGIDERLAINFFGRFHLINRMLPLLSAASEKGEHVSVLSVLSAGEGTIFEPDDIGLTENYSLLRAASQSSICNDLMAEVVYAGN